jgi:membrane-anchored protein YejM (alkaline phosphatase superfamily)
MGSLLTRLMEMIEYEHHHHHVFGGVEELVIKTSWLFRIDTTNTNKYIYIYSIYIYNGIYHQTKS